MKRMGIESLRDFVSLCVDLQRSDRGVNLIISGFTGEGKSTFGVKFAQEHARITGIPFSFDNITWNRNELLTWVDGEKEGKAGPDGLKPGQKPEYSLLIADEMFKMIYRRTWYEAEQIDMIATFNSCRDRHLIFIGCNPYFWDLDNAFTSQIRFYVYVSERGRAWVFQQENNPFSIDPWNIQENRKNFRKAKNPFKLNNFVCEITYNDFEPKEKEEYLKIRNTKRLSMFDEADKPKEKYKTIKDQRDKAINLCYEVLKEAKANPSYRLTETLIANKLCISREAVRIVHNK